MFRMNWLAILVSALIPLAVGFVWYHPRVLGAAWMRASGVTEDQIKSSNLLLIFGLSLLFSLLIALMVVPLVVHQMHVGSVLASEPGFRKDGSAVMVFLSDFMKTYGDRFRTFKHGALHGLIAGLLLVTPIIGTNALFERRGFRYIAINAGYWIVCLVLMGGVLSAWR